MSAGRLGRVELTNLPQGNGRLSRAELTVPTVVTPPVVTPPTAPSAGRLGRVELAATEVPAASAGRLSRVEASSVSHPAGRLSRAELTTVTPLLVSAGQNVAAIEPWSVVTLTGTEAGAAPDSRAWRRISGPAVTLSSPTSATTTYEAPGALTGATVTFGYTATVGGTTSPEATVTHTVLPVTERAVVGGVEVPLRLQVAAV